MEEILDSIDPKVPHYFKFRYDLRAIDPEDVREVIDTLTEGGFFPGTVCVEHRNRYGDEIKPHIHYHFVMNIRPSSLNKTKDHMVYVLKKKYSWKKRPQGWYGLKCEQNVDSTDRLFSYCMKQQEGLYQQPEWLPTPENLEIERLRLVSSEEYERNREFLILDREKKARKTTTYERMLEQYEKTKPQIVCKYDACEFVYQFFVDEGFPPNRTKIREMVDGLLLITGVMSRREFFDSL